MQKHVSKKEEAANSRELLRFASGLSLLTMILAGCYKYGGADCLAFAGIVIGLAWALLSFRPRVAAMGTRFWDDTIPTYGHWFFIFALLGTIVFKLLLSLHLVPALFKPEQSETSR